MLHNKIGLFFTEITLAFICLIGLAYNLDCIIFGYNLGLIALNLSLFFIDPFLLAAIVPIKSYYNAEADKEKILFLKSLDKGKLYVYHSDKNTIAFIFNNYFQAARVLTPNRCAHLSDSELNRRKNLQHIIRVINKGTLTKTEQGKFYLYENNNHSECLDLVPWGINLPSSIGIKNISKQERNMIKLPKFIISISNVKRF